MINAVTSLGGATMDEEDGVRVERRTNGPWKRQTTERYSFFK